MDGQNCRISADCRPLAPIRQFATAFAGFIWLSGCGSTSLTGGSVPTTTLRLAGAVHHADDITRFASGMQVSLSKGAAVSLRTTGADGAFDFGAVKAGDYTCALLPPAGSGLGSGWSWTFALPDRQAATLHAAIWPAAFDTNAVREVSLVPGTLTLKPGESARLNGTAYGPNSSPLPLSPSLLLVGEALDLKADGTVTAHKAGRADVYAWMAGREAHTVVTVAP